MSTPRAAAPRLRTELLDASESDLTNDRWSWGKNGLTNCGTRVRNMVSVERMADLTGAAESARGQS